jgi:hypothetical protein
MGGSQVLLPGKISLKTLKIQLPSLGMILLVGTPGKIIFYLS